MFVNLIQNTFSIIRQAKHHLIIPPPGFYFVIYKGKRVTYKGAFVIYPIT